jgi:ABC-type antimicrobial peptide transport system permease subunit
MLHVNPWTVVLPIVAVVVGLLYWIESAGL